MIFKAAILVETGQPLVMEEIESSPLRFGQVLVKILCSGVCGAQINEIDAVKGPDKFLPHLLGHEATADVVEVGEGVTTVSKGDRVVCHWRKGAGLQAPPAVYTSARGRINAGWVTTFSEYSVVSENRVTRVPSDLDLEAGALMGCAVTTAMGVLNHDAHLGIGESIAVFGTGGVGLSVVQLAAMVAAHPIVAIDLYQPKLELAKRLGATHTIQATGGVDVTAALRAMVGEAGVDVAVETTGNVRAIEQAYEGTAAQGRTVLVGVPRKGEKVSLYTLPLHFKKVLTGSEGGGCRPEVDIPKLVRLCRTGRLNLQDLVGRRYPLERINQAIAELRSGKVAGRCIVQMDASAHRVAAP